LRGGISRFRRKRVVAGAGAVAMLAMVLTACAPAVPPSPVQFGPPTLPATASSMWQTDGAVWALAYANHVVYAGGEFSNIRPPGAAPGSTQYRQIRLAAFHADGPHAGAPCNATAPCPGIGAWRTHEINAQVWSLNISPDQRTLYVGGDFTMAGGAAHSKLMALDISRPNAPIANWNPQINGTVRAIASTGAAVYAGGAFTSAGGAARNYLAAFWARDPNKWQLLTGFTPAVDDNVYALSLGPPANDSHRLVLGGRFRVVNGQPHSGIAQVDLGTGRVNGPMDNSIIPGVGNGGATHSDVKTIITDSTRIYLGAEGTGAGIFDGTASIDPTTGHQIWKNTCLGATQAIALIGNALYIGSHSHNCQSLPRGGFPQNPYQTGYKSWHHLIAEQAVADSSAFSGGQLLTWFPVLNPGPTNGSAQNELGPRAMATDGTNLFVGGQQTTVNGVGQQGLTRFTPGPDRTPPARPYVKSSSPSPGNVTIRWTSSTDPDRGFLSYGITRSDSPGILRYSASSVYSPWWVNKSFVWRESNVPAGVTYTVTVSNGTQTSSSTTAPVRTTGYANAVRSDNPTLYWPLDDLRGGIARDASGHGQTGKYSAGIRVGQPGAINGNAGVVMNGGATTSIAQNRGTYAPPSAYSLEFWFKSTTRNGGKLIGWSSSPTGTSAQTDRSVYLEPSGQLIFAARQPTANLGCVSNNQYFVSGWCYAWSKQDYNDGGWHHVVATQSTTTGLRLYVDNILVSALTGGTSVPSFNGVWRVGGDSVSGLPRAYAAGLDGAIDDVSIYNRVLSQAQVTQHYIAGQ
jgi:hypothetical protein